MGAVAVIGSATIDRVVQGGVVAYKRGGVVAYAGLTFAELGVETRVLTNVVEADRAMLAVLQQRGIAVHVGESAATTCFVNYVDGDARRQELLTCCRADCRSPTRAGTRWCGARAFGAAASA